MKEFILRLPEQLAWQPETKNLGQLPSDLISRPITVMGMGGSHLAADLLAVWQPDLDLTIWSDYDLPPNLTPDQTLIISSYSGQTIEALTAAKVAQARQLTPIIISSGGQLLALAEDCHWPYIQLPAGWPPRQTVGFGLKALAAILNQPAWVDELAAVKSVCDPAEWEPAGQALANQLSGTMPIIYTNRFWQALAYNWKIKFNETGKLPAGYNIIPEANHNDLAGFDPEALPQAIRSLFSFVILIDQTADIRHQKRLEILADTYRSLGWPTETIILSGDSRLEKIFTNLTLADWTAYYLATARNQDPIAVPLIEAFKRRLAD